MADAQKGIFNLVEDKLTKSIDTKKKYFACIKNSNCLGQNGIVSEENSLNDNLNKKRINSSSNINEGRWQQDEHDRFLVACFKFGEDWKKIEEFIGTRNIIQIRSHAQKYIIKLCKKYSIKLNTKKFKNKKSVHLKWSLNESKKKKLSINQMNKFDRNILERFSYYQRDYSLVNYEKTKEKKKAEFPEQTESPDNHHNQPAMNDIFKNLESLLNTNKNFLNDYKQDFFSLQKPVNINNLNITLNDTKSYNNLDFFKELANLESFWCSLDEKLIQNMKELDLQLQFNKFLELQMSNLRTIYPY